ncbi:MAG: hypothetical protein GX558_12730 [Clostridiales bacterium]|nr:hypothetical protein [Clostridiales bacterium]
MAGILDRYQDALLLSLQGADHFQLAPPSGDREAWAHLDPVRRSQWMRAADRAAGQLAPLTIADYLGDADGYARACFERRDALFALALGLCAAGDDRYAPALAELIWAILGEPCWTLPATALLSPDGLPLPDPAAPLVDEAAALTAGHLAMAAQLAGGPLNRCAPGLLRMMEWEALRRVVAPFLAVPDMGWMRGPRGGALRCLSGVTMAFLTFERDDRRRWQCMRKAWQLLGSLLKFLAPDGGVLSGLESWQQIAGNVTDLLYMVRAASGGEVDARREPTFGRLARFPALCHIAGGWFFNPGERSMRPALDGAEVFRIGMLAQDAAVCDLGAYLSMEGSAGSAFDSVLREAQRALNDEALLAGPFEPQRPIQAYLPTLEYMIARWTDASDEGPILAAHGGDNGVVDGHLDVGDALVFFGGQPALIDAGCLPGTDRHNLPTVGGWGQGAGEAFRAEDVSCRLERDYAMLSMNLARAYPDEAGVFSWQRTALLTRADKSVQIMDLFDLRQPADVAFHFLMPEKPSLGEKYAQLGAVRLRWEEELDATLEEISLPAEGGCSPWGGAVYCLTLATRGPVKGGRYGFTLKEIRTYGT